MMPTATPAQKPAKNPRQYAVICSTIVFMPTVDEIHALVRERLEEVRAAKDEFDRLEKALAALDGAAQDAPYGLRSDGKPRRRPGRRPATPAPEGS